MSVAMGWDGATVAVYSALSVSLTAVILCSVSTLMMMDDFRTFYDDGMRAMAEAQVMLSLFFRTSA